MVPRSKTSTGGVPHKCPCPRGKVPCPGVCAHLNAHLNHTRRSSHGPPSEANFIQSQNTAGVCFCSNSLAGRQPLACGAAAPPNETKPCLPERGGVHLRRSVRWRWKEHSTKMATTVRRRRSAALRALEIAQYENSDYGADARFGHALPSGNCQPIGRLEMVDRSWYHPTVGRPSESPRVAASRRRRGRQPRTRAAARTARAAVAPHTLI